MSMFMPGMGLSTANGGSVPMGTPQSAQGSGVNASFGANAALGSATAVGAGTLLMLLGFIVVAYWGTRQIQGLK